MIDTLLLLFPWEFSATAQIISCASIILFQRTRLTGWKLAVLLLAMVALQALVNHGHMDQPNSIWLFFTLLGHALMLLWIFLGARLPLYSTLVLTCHAIMESEFASALAWQINCYLTLDGYIHFPDPEKSDQVMLLVYALVYVVIAYRFKKRSDLMERYQVTGKDALRIVFITVIAYVGSNFYYAFPHSTVAITMGAGVLSVRTVIDLCGLLTIIANEESWRSIMLQMELKNVQNLFNLQYNQYLQYEQNNEYLHRAYHDLKHQLAIIRSETDEKKRKGYLDHIQSILDNRDIMQNTGNSVLDVILNSTGLMCEQNHIKMTCYADASRLAFMEDMDICSLFGNAIDNAIECECKIDDYSKRLIKVLVNTQNQFLLIQISNYCDELVDLSTDTPATTKRDRQAHGYGIRSIRISVERYGGHMTMEQIDRWFILSALIPLPSEKA